MQMIRVNVAEKLKYYHGELYTPMFGKGKFLCIVGNEIFVNFENEGTKVFNWDGTYGLESIEKNEIVLFPSEYIRDWGSFTTMSKDISRLQKYVNHRGEIIILDYYITRNFIQQHYFKKVNITTGEVDINKGYDIVQLENLTMPDEDEIGTYLRLLSNTVTA